MEKKILLLIDKKHFNKIKVVEDDERIISSNKPIKFKVNVIIHYFNDAGDKAPIPILRSFKINVDSSGIQFDR